MKKSLSLEYCHVTPGFDNKKIIKEANKWMPIVLKMFDGWKVQKCIMIDDIHTKQEVADDFVKKIVDKLDIKPDCVYKESEFIFEAHQMIKKINPRERDFIISDEKTWLRENVEKYRSSTEFLLSWKKKSGKIEYSCPTLAATSYLVRLGYIKGDGVKQIYGETLKTASHVLTVLSSEFLQVEDKAQSIVEATFKDALRKVSWFFY